MNRSTNPISKSICYNRFETRNELRYYEPPVLVTYGLRIGIKRKAQAALNPHSRASVEKTAFHCLNEVEQ